MAEKQNPKERLKEITNSIETVINELLDSDKYKSLLQTMSHFHKYALNNTIIISMQTPDATLVAGSNKWHNGFYRYIKRAKTQSTLSPKTATPSKLKSKVFPLLFAVIMVYRSPITRAMLLLGEMARNLLSLELRLKL